MPEMRALCSDLLSVEQKLGSLGFGGTPGFGLLPLLLTVWVWLRIFLRCAG